MGKIIKTEFLKLKRYSVIKAGIIMTVLSPLLSLFYSTANGGQTWTFDYFMQQVMISNCTLFFPIIIALIAGYIITREYTDDTMKNISTIPISYKQLLSGKLLVLLLLTICFSFIGCVLALVINVIAGFPGVHFGNLLNMFIRVTGANLGIYISVLPIILLFCCSVNNFLGGVALAFVYGYFGTFEGTLLNYYPIKASMILVDPTCGAEYGYTYHIFPAFIIMVLTFLISVIILANNLTGGNKDAKETENTTQETTTQEYTTEEYTTKATVVTTYKKETTTEEKTTEKKTKKAKETTTAAPTTVAPTTEAPTVAPTTVAPTQAATVAPTQAAAQDNDNNAADSNDGAE